MAAAIVGAYRKPVGNGHGVESITLVPSHEGVFDVVVNGELVFSKFEAGRHTTADEILTALRARQN